MINTDDPAAVQKADGELVVENQAAAALQAQTLQAEESIRNAGVAFHALQTSVAGSSLTEFSTIVTQQAGAVITTGWIARQRYNSGYF